MQQKEVLKRFVISAQDLRNDDDDDDDDDEQEP